MRNAVRTLVETVAVHGGLAALGRRRIRDRIAVIAYHNVVPRHEAGRGDASLHLPLDRFLEQIEQLSATHEIVDLRQAESRTSPKRPRAVITFDDAYRGAIAHAVPELEVRGIPAVIFVAPELLGAAGTWWDELGEAGVLTAETRTAALHELEGDPTAVRERFLPGERPQLPDSYGIATREELDAVVGRGITIGSHAWAHEHLPSLAATALEISLADSLTWVRESGPDGTPWLALPFGAGTDSVAREARRAGYDGVLRISGGLWQPERGAETVPRINVPAGLSAAGLALRTSGLRT